ncbi:MAG: FMN-binding negative transcriptional regulator [Propionibacteriaceae bacterium]|jgi:transcriptional regulator|nr:FMN-binding negative transcriptional regulator [Propionibacteriaceae bacterium]
MHIPDHFKLDPAEAQIMLANAGAADVVAVAPTGLEAGFLPLEYHGNCLATHIGRANPLAKLDGASALAIFHGPDAYIRSTWLRVSPQAKDAGSWNYITVHAYGTLHIHTDDDAVWTQVMRHQYALEPDFDASTITAEHKQKMLRAMVCLELEVERVEAKAKMSQNKSPEVVRQVVAGLREAGCAQVADWMEAYSLPRAVAKQEMLAQIKAGRSQSAAYEE